MDFFEQLEKRIKLDIPLCMSSAIDNAIPIWQALNLTEEEYNTKYYKPVLVEEKTIENDIKEGLKIIDDNVETNTK
jgi:hypothetical protein